MGIVSQQKPDDKKNFSDPAFFPEDGIDDVLLSGIHDLYGCISAWWKCQHDQVILAIRANPFHLRVGGLQKSGAGYGGERPC